MLDNNTKPVILIVDPEGEASRAFEELVARYSRDYTIVVDPDVATACQRMRELFEAGSAVALILADRASNGAALLDDARVVLPQARRGLLLNWNESRSHREEIADAFAQRRAECFVTKPSGSPERAISSQHHRALGRVVACARSALHRGAHRRRRTNRTGVRDVRPAAAARHAVRIPRPRLRDRRRAAGNSGRRGGHDSGCHPPRWSCAR